MSILTQLAQYPEIYIPFAAILGLLVGSFLNVVVYRLPKMMEADWTREAKDYLGLPVDDGAMVTLCRPASACPSCGRGIKPWENIPVVSYLCLRGRCAGCQLPISCRYPLVEMLGGAAGALSFWYFGFSIQAFAFACALWSLTALTLIDLDTMILPDSIVLPLLWGGLLLTVFTMPDKLADSVLGAAAGYIAFRIIPIGRGDAKLAGAAGAWLGIWALPFFLTSSAVIATVVGGIYFLIRKESKPYPFGPSLAVSFVLSIFFSESYASLLGIK